MERANLTKKKGKKKLSKKQNRLINLGLVVLFLVGFLITAYPFISNWYYRIDANRVTAHFDEEAKKLKAEEINRRFELAQAYNKTLDPSRISDPYTDKEKKGIAEYARMLEVEEMLGYVDIPKINQKLPIYAGTSSDILEKGAGHLEGTSLPIGGESTHTVITAHRGLPKAELFTNLDKLKKGDIFYIHNIKEVLAYQVDQISVVKPDDFSKLLVTEGKDYATLLTCTPYSINTHRLLVRGHRIAYVPPVKEKNQIMKELQTHYKLYFIISSLIAFGLFLLLMHLRRWLKERKQKEKKDDSA